MAGCDPFEIAIEARLHGAPADPGLDAHLGACEACRAYEAAARGAEAALRASAREVAGKVDWAGAERRVRGGRPAAVRMAAGAALALAWVAAVVWLSTPSGRWADRMVRSLPAMAILAVLSALVAGYADRRLVALAEQGQALETCRHLALASLTWARRMQWATAALVAFFLYKALTGTVVAFDPAVYFGGLALPLAGAWLYLRRVTVPRATREVLDLGLTPEGGG